MINKKRILQQFVTIGDALSQLANAVFFGSTNANESISGRAARVYIIEDQDHRGWKFMYKTINFIFFWQQNHCLESFYNDVERTETQNFKNKMAIKASMYT